MAEVIRLETRRDHFCWTVLDTRGEATEPPDLLEITIGCGPWPAPAVADDLLPYPW